MPNSSKSNKEPRVLVRKWNKLNKLAQKMKIKKH